MHTSNRSFGRSPHSSLSHQRLQTVAASAPPSRPQSFVGPEPAPPKPSFPPAPGVLPGGGAAGSPPGSTTGSGGSIDPPAPGASPSSIVRGGERAERVRLALADHPDELGAAILRMRFFEDLSLPEIARRLEMDYDPVRIAFRSAKRHLQKELSDWL